MSDLVISVAAIKKLKVTELKAELAKRGLSTKGKKDELMSRLISEVEGEGATEENEDLPQPEDVSVTECTEASEIESQDVTFSDPTSSVSTLCMEDGVSSATEAMEVAADARAADKHTSISQSLAHVDSVEPTSGDLITEMNSLNSTRGPAAGNRAVMRFASSFLIPVMTVYY